MKKIVLLLAVSAILCSCNSNEYSDQRCYGLLIDSLTKLARYEDRVAALEQGASVVTREYQLKIKSLQKIVDSLSAHRAAPKLKRISGHYSKPHPAAKVKYSPKMITVEDDMNPSFYYDDDLQKYFYYDSDRKVYYYRDPVTGQRRYIRQEGR